jgi:hypothetical protein
MSDDDKIVSIEGRSAGRSRRSSLPRRRRSC